MYAYGLRSPDLEPGPLVVYVHKFTKGQPLGYYSSWPLFTLTHHMVVWLAAKRVYPGNFGTTLCMNDLVIADPAVADAYLSIMTEYEVTISSDLRPPSSRPVELVLVSLLSDS